MIRRHYRVVCNGCLTVFDWEFGNEKVSDAHQHTTSMGWKHIGGGRDYCPECAQKE